MKLTCDDLSTDLHYYIDNELDEAARAELEAHLSECSSCHNKVQFHLRLKQEIKRQAAPERAPDALRAKIMASIAAESATRQTSAPALPAMPRSRAARVSMAAAAAAATILVVVLPAFTIAPAASDQLPIIKQTVDWHRGDFPLDIQTSDAAQASRWFRDKVDFPVRLPRFDVGRARLIGARLANVQDRRAVYALYEVDGGQRVSVMLFHGDGLEVPSDKVKTIADHEVALIPSNGFDVAVLQDQGITYTFTSDLPDSAFVTLMSDSLRR